MKTRNKDRIATLRMLLENELTDDLSKDELLKMIKIVVNDSSTSKASIELFGLAVDAVSEMRGEK